MKTSDLQHIRARVPLVRCIAMGSLLLIGTPPPGPVLAQSESKGTQSQRPRPERLFDRVAPLPMDGGVRLRLNQAAYTSLKALREVSLTDFALEEGRSVDLELEQFSVFDDRTRFVLGTPDGDKPVPPPDVLFLRGIVKGNKDSHVFLALSPYGNTGYVRLAGETFFLLSNWGKIDPAAPGKESIVVERGSIPERFKDDPFTCRVETVFGVGGGAPGGVPGDGEEGTTARLPHFRIADVALDATFAFYELLGSNWIAAHAYTGALAAGSSAIYERDVQLKLRVVYSRVWMTSDPLGSSLDDFRDWWNSNGGAVQRNHVHKIMPGSGGVAYRDCCGASFLCNTRSSYAITRVDSTLSDGEFHIFCQELGHNMGSQHTHCYVPPIDECQTGESHCEDTSCPSNCFTGTEVQTTGTIMSYCSSTTLDFHTRVQSFLESNILGDSCLTVALSPTYVNFAAIGFENGTSSFPWNTVLEGVAGVTPGGSVMIAPGIYRENNITIRHSATLKRWGTSGTVTIGD